MSVDGDDAVGVFRYHLAVRVHAESSHQIVVFIGLVHEFAFIYVVGYMLENFGRQLHSDTYVHSVFLLLDAETVAD